MPTTTGPAAGPTTLHDHASSDRPTGGARRLLLAAAVLLGLGWVAVVPLLTLRGLLATAPFLGEQPDAADRLAQHHDLGAALLVGAAAVAAGVVLSVRAGSRAGVTAFALLALPTLVLALLWVGTVPAPSHPAPTHPAASTSPTRPQACQELSGGDTRCPGG